jgi:hypothetical protein
VPSLPSRGQLCLAALRSATLGDAAERTQTFLTASRYNPFNLVCATIESGWVATWKGGRTSLRRGRTVVSNRGDANDARLPVVRRARRLLRGADLSTPPLETVLDWLAGFCADTGGAAPICRPGGERGTVSSSLIALDASGHLAAYRHAPGPPSETPYEDVLRLS